MSAQREAFERAFPRLDFEKWMDGRYRSIASCDAWNVWQAAQAAMQSALINPEGALIKLEGALIKLEIVDAEIASTGGAA